jgi:uncharacterized protein YsxB (DUF464 family)
MISVKYTYDIGLKKCSLRLKGHSGQNDIGKDIICSSASILAYTMAQIVKALEHHGDLAEEPTIKLESGDALIECVAKDEYLFAEMMQYFYTINTGYSLLAHNYPQYVELILD